LRSAWIVVAVGLALQGRAFAKPATGWHTGEGHGLALGVVGAHFQEAVDHAKPIRHRAARARDEFAGAGFGHLQVAHRAFALGRLQHTQPRNGGEFALGQWAAALVQGAFRQHGERCS
jgi:hypothetical protein